MHYCKRDFQQPSNQRKKLGISERATLIQASSNLAVKSVSGRASTKPPCCTLLKLSGRPLHQHARRTIDPGPDHAGITRQSPDWVIHRVFDPACLEFEIKDRFGQPVVPREWFLVPLFVIDEAIKKIRDGTISTVRYDPKSASLVEDVRS
jgi:hypothetical protein